MSLKTWGPPKLQLLSKRHWKSLWPAASKQQACQHYRQHCSLPLSDFSIFILASWWHLKNLTDICEDWNMMPVQRQHKMLWVRAEKTKLLALSAYLLLLSRWHAWLLPRFHPLHLAKPLSSHWPAFFTKNWLEWDLWERKICSQQPPLQHQQPTLWC